LVRFCPIYPVVPVNTIRLINVSYLRTQIYNINS
jgi:hypothetical protein